MLDAFNQNLYGPGFVYSVDRAFVATCQTPCLVLAGNDAAHPFAISEELVQLLPNAELHPGVEGRRTFEGGENPYETVPEGAHARSGLVPSPHSPPPPPPPPPPPKKKKKKKKTCRLKVYILNCVTF